MPGRVSRQGLVNQDSYHPRTSAHVFEQPDRTAYLILDSATMVEPAYRFQQLIDGLGTVGEMERGLGIPACALAETMVAYDEAAGIQLGEASCFGRRAGRRATPRPRSAEQTACRMHAMG